MMQALLCYMTEVWEVSGFGVWVSVGFVCLLVLAAFLLCLVGN